MRRIDIIRIHGGARHPAGRLVLDGEQPVTLEVLADNYRSELEPLMKRGIGSDHLGRKVTPDDGNAFLDAVVTELGRSTYWDAQEEKSHS